MGKFYTFQGARLLGRHNWIAELPWVMLGLRSAPNLDTGVSPALLVMGQHPALPGHLITPRNDILDHTAFSESLARAMDAQVFRGNPWHGGDRSVRRIPPSLQTAASVLVRRDCIQNSLEPKYDGPFKVINREKKHFTLLRNGQSDVVSVDRLKPFYDNECSTDNNIKEYKVPTSDHELNHDECPSPSVRPKRQSKPPRRYGYP